MISAVHHGEVGAPGADRLAVLLRHDARRLRDVPQVVCDPGGQQLTQRDRSELRMLPLPGELSLREAPSSEYGQVLRPQARELVEELRERLALALTELRVAVVGREPALGSL